MLQLVERFLKQDIMEDMKRWTPTSGSPQGAVISPLLANVYLHELNVEMRQAGQVLVHYADDAWCHVARRKRRKRRWLACVLGERERSDAASRQNPSRGVAE